MRFQERNQVADKAAESVALRSAGQQFRREQKHKARKLLSCLRNYATYAINALLFHSFFLVLAILSFIPRWTKPRMALHWLRSVKIRRFVDSRVCVSVVLVHAKPPLLFRGSGEVGEGKQRGRTRDRVQAESTEGWKQKDTWWEGGLNASRGKER